MAVTDATGEFSRRRDDERSRLRSAAVGALLVEAAAERVLAACATKGIRPIVLKGPALARWLDYPDRITSDLDLLVPTDVVASVEFLLADLGYRGLVLNFVDDRPHHARTWASPTGGADIDLHWTLVGLSAPEIWQRLVPHAIEFELGGVRALMLDDSGQALHVALHAAQHGAGATAELDDLRRALRRTDASVWHNAARLAEELDAVPAFSAGLQLVEEGRELYTSLDLASAASVESELRAASELPHTALGFAWLASKESRGFRARFLLRKAVPPAAVVRGWSSFWLPWEPKGPLLVLAYLWRVVWLIRYAPKGMRAWHRARRRASSAASRSEPNS